MQSDLCFSLEDSLKSVIRACGGAKAVGHKLRPELDADAAGRWLLTAINPTCKDKLSLEQLLLILRMGHDVGCHDGMDFITRDCGYAEASPITPEDEQDELMREFIAAAKLQVDTAARMERITSRIGGARVQPMARKAAA